MTRKEKALQYFAAHFHCSQSVLAAYADQCGLTEQQALKLGGCFGSGMRKGEVCGACTGALMVLGALYGQDDKEDLAARELSNTVNDKMTARFKERCGSYICNDILGYDITTPDGIASVRAKNLFKTLCPQMVANAMDILAEIIEETEKEKQA
ncbi:MAG: C_GCAxxG_C_C family protein [Lachnospiraceae bacterium]|nr:C_GCAxxG_C_C family protein [Lachnospiraceae bacterium]